MESKLEETLAECLERMAHGESIDSCLHRYPAERDELEELLHASVMLSAAAALPPIDLAKVERLALARAAELHARYNGSHQRSKPLTVGWIESIRMSWSRLIATPRSAVLVVSGVLALILLVAFVALRSAAPSGNQTAASPSAPSAISQATQPAGNIFLPAVSGGLGVLNPQSGALSETRGMVEIQASDGTWARAKDGQSITAGQRLRTGQLSGVTVQFFDGSWMHVGALSEFAIDELDAQSSGPRVVQLTQSTGESDHAVVTSSHAASRYVVNTPAGSSTATGTAFHVSVGKAQATRVRVDEGSVDVTGSNTTVNVNAGEVTTLKAGAPPAEPVFHVIGEGIVTQIGVVWRIGGLDFAMHDDTSIVGRPQIGDRVFVEGRLRPDGTRVADVILLIERAPENRFRFTGAVEAIGNASWIVAGRTVSVNDDTELESSIEVGDVVHVSGVIRPDGTLLAQRIRRVDDATGLPFEFLGMVENMGGTWTISGVAVATNDQTRIDGGIDVGDIVKVRGRILADGTWLATTIRLIEDDEQRFEFTGIVQSMGPWIVSGIGFATDDQTDIELGIQIGDRVIVEGRVLDDGRWLATEIRLLKSERDRFEFIGRVSRIDPWMIGGLDIAVNGMTRIDAGIVADDLVKVKGRVLRDGTLLAEAIELIRTRPICFDIRARVVRIDGNSITLNTGQTLELSADTVIVGNLRVGVRVIIHLCVDEDGVIVLTRVIVIEEIQPTPTIVPPAPTPTTVPPPPPPPPPPGGGDDDDDDDDDD